ncbi:MAG: adenylate/guanylate cyclase domain-containing protein [Chloroflexota bacterium]|nr:adenylate/guanylate cyclase domain-containing protein [Chloroflexota bacterium]
MRCPQCRALNSDTASHCTTCGAALISGGTTSRAAGEADIQQELAAAREAVRRLRHYISPVVAEGILHDQERLRGERREVAVLFADAVNFTHLSASLDAESVFGLINDLMGRLVECVHRYDGVVDKFTGDGLMAVFGAPIAHENDPELAVRAALDMQRAAVEFEPIARAQLGAPLQTRIGIHSGPVVAGIIGTQEQAAYTVIGETVNLAARLEALARPDHILVSSRVYHQTHALFNFQALGTARVKGFAQPVAVYEMIGDRSEPLPTRGVTGVTAILLGRDAELEQSCALLAAFLDDQYGRMMMIQGEAGMGKSRLVTEWLSTIKPDQVAIWQGHGLPYAQGVGYGIFRSLLQDAQRTYPPDVAWDSQVSPALRPFLRQMLGLTLAPEEQVALRYLEPERIKQLTTLALREWLLGEAHRRPVILILDDFHWADDLSRDMLQSLVNLIHEAPVLLCIITRPQPEAPLDLALLPTDKSLAAPLALSLKLKPLSPEHGRSLLGHLVNLNDLPEPLINTILTRAEGNPLYIEEFVRVLIEKEILTLGDGQWQVASNVALQTLEIPTTLRGLMMARVDRLPEDLQHVLRDAAVIGLQFAAPLLEEVERRLHGTASVLPPLERLTDLGLLVERPQAGEQVYAFRHILTQETVYNSLLRSQRPGLHRTVAECIEGLYADDLNNQAEVLALHYYRAHVRDKAMRYALLAGDRARERFANREAIEYYSRALQNSQHLGNYHVERWQAAVGLGQVEQHIGEYEEATACYQAALEEGDAVAPGDRAQAMLRLGQVWDKRGDLKKAEDWLYQGLEQIGHTSAPLPELQARIYSELSWLSLRQGDLAVAQEWLEQGLSLIGTAEHYDVLSSILNRLGAVHYNRGEWDEAAECVERALGLRERMGDIVGYARSLNNLGILKRIIGDWDGALADCERVLELHEHIGEVEGLALAHTNLGVLYTERGEWAKAEENLRHSFAIAQRIDQPQQLALAHMNLGRLYLLQERWEECTQHLNAAIPLYIEAGDYAMLNMSDAYMLQSRLHLEQGQADTALQWAKRGHELLREATCADEGESLEWGRYERLAGRIAQAHGDLVTARRHLKHSAAIFHATGSQIEVGRTTYRSALLSLALGQPEQAREELLAARQIFERLGATADLRHIEQQLAHLE